MVESKKKVINFYQTNHPYGEFSNFYPAKITLKGKEWATTEHYFQAMKFEGTDKEETIRNCKTPGETAAKGRQRDPNFPLRKDWEDVKEAVMYEAIKVKFTNYAVLNKKLLDTGDALLIEHTTNDSYWGDGGDGSGKNRLGILLMKLRDELNEKDIKESGKEEDKESGKEGVKEAGKGGDKEAGKEGDEEGDKEGGKESGAEGKEGKE